MTAATDLIDWSSLRYQVISRFKYCNNSYFSANWYIM